MNIFEAVKQSVTTRQAAERYGIRVGRNGMAACPFHSDKTPSMKVDRRFHCFGCQADGDVKRTQRRIDHKPRLETEEQRFKRLEWHCFKVLSDYYHLLRRWKTQYAPRQPDGDWNPLFVEALQKESHVEYLLDTLLFGTLHERVSLIIEYGKEVRNLE